MFLHLGQETVITTESIVAMFDIDACTVSKKTRDFLTKAENKGEVVNVSYELPKAYVVCEKQGKTVVYITQLSTKTLLLRTESSTSTHKFPNM